MNARALIGSILFVLVQISTMLLYVPVALLLRPFLSPITFGAVVATWSHLLLAWLRITCGLSVRVRGLENIPESPSIIAANHQSEWETLAFQTIFPVQSYIMKKSLRWIPFFGWGLAANYPIAIDRGTPNQAMKQIISQGKDRLKLGRWLVIFPEGTRQKAGKPSSFLPGGAFIATQTQTQVVPVAHNAGVFWPKNGFIKHAGVIDVVIGAPISPEGKKPRAVNVEIETWIKAELEKLPNQA